MKPRVFYANQRRSQTYTQSENATLDYTIDWTVQNGSATIATSTWTSKDGLTITNTSNTTTTAKASFNAQPGSYRATNTMTDSNGAIDTRHIDLVITLDDRPSQGTDYGERC